MLGFFLFWWTNIFFTWALPFQNHNNPSIKQIFKPVNYSKQKWPELVATASAWIAEQGYLCQQMQDLPSTTSATSLDEQLSYLAIWTCQGILWWSVRASCGLCTTRPAIEDLQPSAAGCLRRWWCLRGPCGCKPKGGSGEEPGVGFQSSPLKLMTSPELQDLNGCLSILLYFSTSFSQIDLRLSDSLGDPSLWLCRPEAFSCWWKSTATALWNSVEMQLL